MVIENLYFISILIKGPESSGEGSGGSAETATLMRRKTVEMHKQECALYDRYLVFISSEPCENQDYIYKNYMLVCCYVVVQINGQRKGNRVK